MQDLKTFRKAWSARQKTLREIYKTGTDLEGARDLFYVQHGVLHSQKIFGRENWSYADEIFTGLNEDQFRIIPDNEEHSLIWILWHISRIEDITMNILVAGIEQIYSQNGWEEQLQSPINHTCNEGSIEDIKGITENLDPEKLLAYRDDVGRSTRVVVRDIPSIDWQQKVNPARLARLRNAGAVLPEAEVLLAYWGKRKIYELFLMPPTRHLLVHLNEAYAIKQKLVFSI